MESINQYTILETGDIPLKQYPFKNKEIVRHNIIQAIKQIDSINSHKKQLRQRILNITTTAVATVVMLMGTVYFFSAQTISTPGIKVLPDGSIVRLGQNSTLKYNSMSWMAWREVQIEGFGNFKVKHGSTFKVETELGYVKIVGTIFDVQTSGDTLKVACHQGKVAVGRQNHTQKEITLEKGRKIEWSANNIHQSYIVEPFVAPQPISQPPIVKPVVKAPVVPAAEKPIVKKQEPDTAIIEPAEIPEPQIRFENAHLSQVIKAIEKRWNVTVILNTPIDEIYFTGAILPRSLDTTMLIITRTSGLKYQINGSQVVVHK